MFLKLISILLILATFSACKLQKLEDKKPSTNSGIESYAIGDAIRAERFLNATEKQIGSRVCRDLRAKRNRWEVSRDDVRFTFNVRSRTTCSGSLTSYSLVASVDLTGGELVLDTTSRSRFISEVLTDEHPALLDICDDLLAGQADVNNSIEQSGSRFQATFYEIASSHYVLLTRFLKDATGVWRAALVDESLVTVAERTGQTHLHGVVVRRAQATQCGTNGSTYTDQQIR